MNALTIEELEGPDSGLPTRAPRNKRRWWVISGIGIAIATGLVAYGSFAGQNSSIRVQDVGFVINGSESVTLRFNVAKPKDVTVVCDVEALSHSFAQVGVVEVTVGPANTSEQEVSVTIPTVETAVTATADSCTIPR